MNLATIHFDTHKVVKLLQEKGFSETQAEGFMVAMQEIALSGVATQKDVADLKEEIQNSRSDIFKFQMIQTIAIIGVMIALFQVF